MSVVDARGLLRGRRRCARAAAARAGDHPEQRAERDDQPQRRRGSAPSGTRPGWPRSPAPRGGGRTSRRGPRRRGADRSHPRRCLPSRPWSPTRPWFRRTLHGAYDPAVALEMVDTWVEAAGVPAVAAAIVGPEGVRETRAAGEARAGEPLRARVAHEADRRARRARRRRGGGARPRRAGRPPSRGVRRRAARRGDARGTCSRTRRACPSPARPASRRSRSSSPARPATRRVYSNEGYAVLGRADRRGDGHPAPGLRPPGGVRAARHGRLPRPAGAARTPARSEVREPGMWRPGLQLFNSREWRRRAHRRGRGVRDGRTPTRASSRCSCARGAPLHRARDLRRHGAHAVPGPRRRDRVVPDRGTSPTGGSAATSATRRSRTGSRPPARPSTLSHFGAAGTRHVGRPGRARRARVPGQPGHVLGLDDAAGRLARPLRCRPARGGVKDWRVCPRCAAGLRHGPVRARMRTVCTVTACGLVLYENPAPTVSAIVERDGRVLLTRRGIEPRLGMWDTPGGFIEAGEEPAGGAAARAPRGDRPRDRGRRLPRHLPRPLRRRRADAQRLLRRLGRRRWRRRAARRRDRDRLVRARRAPRRARVPKRGAGARRMARVACSADLQRICDEIVKPVALPADYLTIGRHRRDRTPTAEAEIASPGQRPCLEEVLMDELHEKHVEIDERWLSEWFEFGFRRAVELPREARRVRRLSAQARD